jgi:hypothetical protein
MAQLSTAAANKNLAFARRHIERATTLGDVDTIVEIYLSLVAGSNARKNDLYAAAGARREQLAGTPEAPIRLWAEFRRGAAGSGWCLRVEGDGHAALVAGRVLRTRKAGGVEDIAFIGERVSTSDAYSLYEVA